MTATEKPLHIRQAEGLRALADLIEQTAADIPATYLSSHLYVWNLKSPEQMASLARAALRVGATVDKDISEKQYNLVASFGPVKAMALANRAEVCERVVTGTETVIKTVPDPKALAAVPTVEVTEEVEKVEWVCRPLLAAEQGVALTPELLAEVEHWSKTPFAHESGSDGAP